MKKILQNIAGSCAFLDSWVLAILVAGAVSMVTGCSCLPGTRPMAKYDFSVYHPRAVEVYKPVAGVPPSKDVIYLYLKLENTSGPGVPLSFAHYSRKKHTWNSLLNRLEPVVTVTSENAPILGAPQVEFPGLSGRTICPGHHFPEAMPESGDFPLNEANYRRDFAIRVVPDRSRIGETGVLVVKFSLAYTKVATVDAPFAEFRIPITITDRFRPESVTAEPSQHTE